MQGEESMSCLREELAVPCEQALEVKGCEELALSALLPTFANRSRHSQPGPWQIFNTAGVGM